MKKQLFYIFTLALVVLTASCSREEKNLFDKSAAERLHYAQEQLKQTLLSSENGWELRYFPYPDAAGYAFLCKFEQNGSVLMAANNSITTSDKYKEEAGMWSVDGTQGCVLCFDTYNTLFTEFADPGSDGIGYGGDYEFVVLKTTPERIYLKGKKQGAYLELNRLSASDDWHAYFDAVVSINEDVFFGNDGIQMLYNNGDTVFELTYEEGQFSYTKDEVDYSLGFIITPSGIHFYSGCPMKDTTKLATDFIVNEEKTRLVCTNQEGVFFESKYDEAGFFAYRFANKARWIYSEEGSDEKTVADVNALKDQLAAKGAVVTRFGYDRMVSGMAGRASYDLYVAYLVEGKLMEGRVNMSYSNKDGKIKFDFSSVDSSLEPLLKRLDDDATLAAKKLVAPFADTFTAESYTGSHLNMVQLLLHSTTNNNRRIHVIADKDLM